VNGAGTNTSSQMTLQHIVKPTAAERVPDATPTADLGKFIELFEPDMGSDIKILPLTIEDAISNVDPLPERNTLDSKRTCYKSCTDLTSPSSCVSNLIFNSFSTPPSLLSSPSFTSFD
jgi:hypothetical protein